MVLGASAGTLGRGDSGGRDGDGDGNQLAKPRRGGRAREGKEKGGGKLRPTETGRSDDISELRLRERKGGPAPFCLCVALFFLCFPPHSFSVVLITDPHPSCTLVN